MKKIILGAAAAALTLAAGAAAAQPYGYRGYDDGYGRGYERSYDRGYYRDDYRDGYRGDYRRYRDSDRDGRPDYREWNRDRDRDGRPDQYDRRDNRYGARGYYGGNRWRQGQVYPYWRESRYVIHDYRAYRLPPPRHGYRYYRSDNGDVVMAAIASGVIGAIIGASID